MRFKASRNLAIASRNSIREILSEPLFPSIGRKPLSAFGRLSRAAKWRLPEDLYQQQFGAPLSTAANISQVDGLTFKKHEPRGTCQFNTAILYLLSFPVKTFEQSSCHSFVHIETNKFYQFFFMCILFMHGFFSIQCILF